MNVTLSHKKIAILGAGISGLTAAYLLKKNGYEAVVLEKRNQPGGSIITDREKEFLIERGPNSALETTPLIGEMIDDLNLHKQLVYGNKESNKRYILRDNKLHPLPASSPAFLKTKLFSTQAKLRLLLEPFIGCSADGYYQSISDFVKRRLGEEFLDYAINPFVAGVYAGDPAKLSVKSAFPLLYNLEEEYGGLIVGTVKSIRERKRRPEKSKQSAKMISFLDGMQVMPQALSDYTGSGMIYQAEVTSIEKKNSGYVVSYLHGEQKESIACDAVISALPAFIASNLFNKFDEKASEHFNAVYYPPVFVLTLAYDKKDVGQPLDGFGFLIPQKERKSFLGAIWNSVIFPNRAGDDKALFTLFIGGARDPEIINFDKEVLIKKVRKEFEDIMKINGAPEFISYKFWSKAIPQYNVGYVEHENYFDEFEKNNPGIILSGNYRGGISVGDCIKNAAKVFDKIKALQK